MPINDTQKALAALALTLSAVNAAPAFADEVDLQSLQLLREESISEADFYAAYQKNPQAFASSGNYSRSGISAGNYSRSGISAGNYSRSGISAGNYSRSGLSSSSYSRSGVSGAPMFQEQGSGELIGPSVSFEDSQG